MRAKSLYILPITKDSHSAEYQVLVPSHQGLISKKSFKNTFREDALDALIDLSDKLGIPALKSQDIFSAAKYFDGEKIIIYYIVKLPEQNNYGNNYQLRPLAEFSELKENNLYQKTLNAINTYLYAKDPIRIRRVISAGVILKDTKGRILAFKRGTPLNDYSFPKGKQEEGETLEQTAARECFEETGLVVKIEELLGSITYEFLWEETREYSIKTAYYFSGTITGGKLTERKGGEDFIEKIGWFDKEFIKREMYRLEMDDILDKI